MIFFDDKHRKIRNVQDESGKKGKSKKGGKYKVESKKGRVKKGGSIK